jgi:serine/threonine protein kinase
VFVCSACRASYVEPGFCPDDGTPLADAQAVAAQTLLSTAMAAQSSPITEVDPRRGTFPLTPTPPASAHTQGVRGEPRSGDRESDHITAARTRVAVETPVPTPLRALSASEDPQAALAAMRANKGESEYDRLVGQTLDGRYFVERKIGEGGMGVVFAARHAVIERPLAIKVLKREVMRDTATIKRFVKEAQAASRIGHPNIVDVTDFGTTPDGMTFSVMEYVDGQTLGSTIRHSSPISMHRAVRITVQIARALGAAHDKGIVHRDLKPENVFLIDRDNRPDFVKIVDFGIAKVAPPPGSANPNEPRLTRAGSVFGTPEYMAPEQAAGRSDTDGRVDIYALGVILYEMLTGRVPHRGDSTVRTLAMVMLDPVDPPRKVRPELDISDELEQVVLKALAKKREQRFQTMHELITALEKLQTPVGLSVTGSPVYALTPLPPGADPSLLAGPRIKAKTPPPAANNVADTPASRQASQSSWGTKQPETVDDRTSPRSRAPTNRIKDEPQFVTREKPITFEHVFTDGALPAQKRLWPYVLLFALILGAGAGAVVLVIKARSHVADAPRDAGRVVTANPDAATFDEPSLVDATDIVVLVDAQATIGVRTSKDAGRPGSAAITTPNGRGTISIQVITKPEDATLYNGTTYTGPGGTNVEQPYGSKLVLTCKKQGYKTGTVEIVFDGKTEVAMCTAPRIKLCIDNIKNPFDDCEIDPSKPVPGPAGGSPIEN